MSETHSLRLEINAAAAKRGASDFEAAIKRIENAVKNLDRSSGTSFGNVQKNIGKINFTQLSQSISRINSLRISPALVNNLKNLSNTMGSMKPIPRGVPASIRALSGALNALNISASSVRSINNLTNALNSIKAPPAGAAAGINLIAQSLRNLRAPNNTGAIVTALTSITNAANATYAALSRLSSLNVNVRTPRTTGGGTGLINPATGRAYGGVQPGYGFGAGRSAASGLRGFENIGNVSYQAGSAVRTAVGGLTAGAFLGQITAVTREADSFRSALTAVGVSAEETARLQEMLAQTTIRLGMDYMTTSQNLRQFVSGVTANGVAVQTASTMFENFSIAMRGSGLNATQSEGALRALTQMFGKGRVMAEELRGQMAEHWSSFGPLFAQYVYPEIEDAAERGRRLSEDLEKRGFNPRIMIGFAARLRQQMGAVAEAQSQTLDASINRTRSAWALLMKQLGEGEAGKALIETFNRFARILQDPTFVNFMQQVGVGLANVLRSLGDAAEFAARNVDLMKYGFLTLLAIGVGNLFIGIARAAANVVQPFIAVGRWLGVLSGGTQTATGAFSTLASTLTTVRTAMTPFLTMLATNPFTIAIASIAALGTGLYLLRDRTVTLGGETLKVRDILVGAWTIVKNIVNDVATGIGNAYREIIKFFTLSPDNAIISSLREFRDLIKDIVNLLPSIPNRGPAEGSPAARNREAGGQGLIGRTPNGANRIEGFGTPENRNVLRDAAVAAREQRLAAERAAAQAQRDREATTPTEALGGRARPPGSPPITQRDLDARAAQFSRDEARRRLESGEPLTPEQRRSLFATSEPNRGGRGGESVENYFARLDAGYGVLERLQDGERMLEEARKRGIGTAEDRVRWEGMIRDSVFESLGALDPATAATRRYEGAMRALDQIERSFPERANEVAAARRRITMATEEARNPVQFLIDQMGEETRLLEARNGVYEDEVALLRIRNQLRQQGIELQGEEENRVRNSISAQRRANQAYKDSQEGMASWANSFRDFGTELSKLEEKFLNQFSDALTELVVNGKADWRSLATSIVTDINQLIIKQGIRELLKWLGLIDGNTADGFKNQGSGILGGIFGGTGSNSGGGISGGRGIFGELFGSSSHNYLSSKSIGSGFDLANSGLIEKGTSDIAGSSSGSFWSSIGSWIGGLFAAEGYMPGSRNNVSAMMPASAFVNAPHFAEGTPNTSRGGGMPAILHDNEAVIPLTRGRKVPVEGGGNTTVMFNISTPDANSFRKSEAQIINSYTRKMGAIRRKGG